MGTAELIAAWAAVAGIVVTAFMPLLVARRILLHADRRPYTDRLQFHQYAGYAIAALATIHAFAAMMAGGAASTLAAGLYAATLALLALFAQAVLGVLLLDPGDYRTPLRRLHRATATAIALAVLAHVALNAPFVGAVLGARSG